MYIYIYLFRERERQRMNQGFNWCCNYCEILGEMWLKNGPMWLVIKLMEKQLIKLLSSRQQRELQEKVAVELAAYLFQSG